MGVHWTAAWNRVFTLMNGDRENGCYYSGGMFVDKVREVDPYFPSYGQLIDQRRAEGKDTGRKGYFYDVVMDLGEEERYRLISSIVDEVAHCDQKAASEVRALLAGVDPGPTATIPVDAWRADRLNDYLRQIDASIAERKFNRTLTLCYTCLEGFYKAYVRKHVPESADEKDIGKLSKAVKTHVSSTLDEYPSEALLLLGYVSNAVDKARNGFSDSHFDEESALWLASYVRDITNSQIRFLMHFL